MLWKSEHSNLSFITLLSFFILLLLLLLICLLLVVSAYAGVVSLGRYDLTQGVTSSYYHYFLLLLLLLYSYSGFKLTNPKCMTVIDQWKRVSSPHIVALREVFTTKAFNDNCKYRICCFFQSAAAVTAAVVTVWSFAITQQSCDMT